MAQDWGVFKDGTNPELWVKVVSPLELSSTDQALLMNEVDANTLADALSQSGELYKPKKPTQHPPR